MMGIAGPEQTPLDKRCDFWRVKRAPVGWRPVNRDGRREGIYLAANGMACARASQGRIAAALCGSRGLARILDCRSQYLRVR